jgi:Predicted metal-dependent hydrolase
MKIYDISQEVFSCDVFPGDELPKRRVLETIDNGSAYNLTSISMCAHNGTHIDAPFHFYKNGRTVDQINLENVIGKCFVTFAEGALSEKTAESIICEAKSIDSDSSKRILIGGNMYVTLEAAKVFAREKILLIGNESQTIGPLEAPAAVHFELLASEVVLLEGIRLEGIKKGIYFLNAAPINLGGADGAPCRAVLIQE